MVKGIPVSNSTANEEIEGIANAAFIEWVGQVWQVLQVMNAASGGLLPSGLPGEHQIGVVKEEEPNHTHCQECDEEGQKEEQVALEPVSLVERNATPITIQVSVMIQHAVDGIEYKIVCSMYLSELLTASM